MSHDRMCRTLSEQKQPKELRKKFMFSRIIFFLVINFNKVKEKYLSGDA